MVSSDEWHIGVPASMSERVHTQLSQRARGEVDNLQEHPPIGREKYKMNCDQCVTAIVTCTFAHGGIGPCSRAADDGDDSVGGHSLAIPSLPPRPSFPQYAFALSPPAHYVHHAAHPAGVPQCEAQQDVPAAADAVEDQHDALEVEDMGRGDAHLLYA